MKKSKFQLKVFQATQRRKAERRSNNRRAAWNRVGRKFGLNKELLDQAKKTDLDPYRLLRDASISKEQVEACIFYSNFVEPRYDSLADYAVDLEIRRLEQVANECESLFDE